MFAKKTIKLYFDFCSVLFVFKGEWTLTWWCRESTECLLLSLIFCAFHQEVLSCPHMFLVQPFLSCPGIEMKA